MIRHVKASNRLRCSGNSPDAVADTAVFTVWNGNTVNVLVLVPYAVQETSRGSSDWRHRGLSRAGDEILRRILHRNPFLSRTSISGLPRSIPGGPHLSLGRRMKWGVLYPCTCRMGSMTSIVSGQGLKVTADGPRYTGYLYTWRWNWWGQRLSGTTLWILNTKIRLRCAVVPPYCH
jgi:hypothetical protein